MNRYEQIDRETHRERLRERDRESEPESNAPNAIDWSRVAKVVNNTDT